MKQITEFIGAYRFLSNFYQKPFEYNGLVYPNAEAAFQAQKCENEADKVKYTETKNPVIAKQMGKREHLPENWDEKSVAVMRQILEAKFAVTELAEMLIATGDAYLEEGNRWHDNKWGRCTCTKCQNKEGQNQLGKMLMGIREGLSEGSMDNLKIDRIDTSGYFFTISWSTDKCHGELIINNPNDSPYETPEIHVACANFLQNFTEEENRQMTDKILKLLPGYIAKNGIFEPLYDNN